MKQVITTKKGTTFEREWDVKGYCSHIHIRIDNKTFDELRTIAQNKNEKYSDIIRQLIKEYISKEGKENENN